MNICECCRAAYEPYKIGKESELFGTWIMGGSGEVKGLCGFCNPKSTIWYIDKPCHKKQ